LSLSFLLERQHLSEICLHLVSLTVSRAITGPPCPDRLLKDRQRIHEKNETRIHDKMKDGFTKDEHFILYFFLSSTFGLFIYSIVAGWPFNDRNDPNVDDREKYTKIRLKPSNSTRTSSTPEAPPPEKPKE
jgi:hypothetical protein